LIVIMRFGNKISTFIFQLNSNFDESKSFKKKIKNLKICIWIVSALIIINLIEQIYNMFTMDESTQKLKESIEK
jgi:hypothetical protein